MQQPVDANVVIPGSKSITNRALLMAAMAEGETTLHGVLASDDTKACVAALRELGISVQWDQQKCTAVVLGCNSQFPNQCAKINCRDAGTLTRFIIPLCAAQADGKFYITGSKRMCERPLAPLLKVLQQQGAEFEFLQQQYCMPLLMKSHGLKGGEVEIDISQSSQFLSGLLIAAPLAKTALTVLPQKVENKPYVKMTKEMMKDFASQRFTPHPSLPPLSSLHELGGKEPGHQLRDRNYYIEPDASTASYFFAIAALTQGRIHVPNLPRNGLQGDTKFLNLLEQMGCQVLEENNGITVTGPKKLKGLGTVSMAGFSDTFMTVAALAVFCDKPTTLTGLAHTRLQESDRVSVMAEELGKLGVKIETSEDSITIYPSQPAGTIVQGHNDHRIAMSLAVIGVKVPDIVIDGAECVAKTCPRFFEMLQSV